MWEKFINTVDHTDAFEPDDIKKNKLIASVSYFGFLFFIPMLFCKKSRFARFHAVQGLLMTITFIILALVVFVFNLVLKAVPDLGSVFATVLDISTVVMCTAIMIFGIVTTLQGKARELPLIGPSKMANKK